MKNRIMYIGAKQLYTLSESYLKKMSATEQVKSMQEAMERRARQVFLNAFATTKISCMIQEFSVENIMENQLVMDGGSVSCPMLELMRDYDICGGYLVAATMKETDFKGRDLLDEYLVSSWKVALLDGTRDFIWQHLHQNDTYVTQALGPGFYGMGLDTVKDLCHMASAEQIGISVNNQNIMNPLYSMIGIYFRSRYYFPMDMDCKSCMGGKEGCIRCGQSERMRKRI